MGGSMLEQLLNNIKQGQEIRENLIELKKCLKGNIKNQDEFLLLLQYDWIISAIIMQ